MTRQPSPRGPGRRSRDTADGDSREALINAARAEFAAHGFRGTTVRQIAARANVTPAMVHYHFKDKHGLYRAMLEAAVGPLMRQLEAIAARNADGSLLEAVHGYMHMLARNPDLPALLMRDVLAADGVMRELFVREFATKAAAAMQRILAREHAAGALRADIDPRLALLSLISMAAFPFIARPVAASVLGLAYDDDMIERLAAHTVELFHHGACRPEAGK